MNCPECDEWLAQDTDYIMLHMMSQHDWPAWKAWNLVDS